MVWFLLAPVAVYGAKKLYDAITEPDPPSSPAPQPSLGPANAERTRVRSEAIMDWFRAHYRRVGTQLGNIRQASKLGPGNVDGKGAGRLDVEFAGYAQALQALNSARQCLDGGQFNMEPSMHLTLTFPDAAEWREKLLRKAEHDYGAMAGITSQHTYDREQDPFLAALRRAQALCE